MLSPRTRSPQLGASLVELLVALAAGLMLMAAAFGLTLSTRRAYDEDHARTRINQNLRAAIDLVGIELRQAGERLPGDMPAVEIVNGADGAPDTLILRRNILDQVLPLCNKLTANTTDSEVRVASTGGTPPQGCAALPDADGNGFFDNIDAWRAHRAANGGAVWAFVYNPVLREGEYFLYDADGSTDNSYLGKGNNAPWTHTYEVTQQCRLYILEQRAYALDDGMLQFTLNEQTAGAIHLSSGMADFQVRAVMEDGTVIDDLDEGEDWTAIAAIDVTLTAESPVGKQTKSRTLSARYFPRNILSN